MKIYQIHKSGGMYEDHYDYIVGSYANKERAETVMADLEQKSKTRYAEAFHCVGCPSWEQLEDNIEQIAQKCAEYCNRFCREDNDDGGFECSNWQSYYEMPGYQIEEVEVIE
jgi:hypothetical protein